MAVFTAVTIVAPPELEEALASFLFDCGAPGLETAEDGALVRLTAHFSGPAPLAELAEFIHALGEIYPGAATPSVAVGEVADDGWAENWKAHFPPLAIGERLFIHPPWVEERPSGSAAVVIDPGMAFGTGQHVSTRGCLAWLDRALTSGTAKGTAPRVLDLGTGSGILAIAAVKLGAGEVWAVDVDPDARTVAAENARRNDVGEALHLAADIAAVPGAFDIVLANLLAGVLIDLAGQIAARVRPGGIAIGAGVLVEEADAVRQAWRAVGLADAGQIAEDGWVALAARRET